MTRAHLPATLSSLPTPARAALSPHLSLLSRRHRHTLLGDPDVQQNFPRCWWYPKNALVFASLAHTTPEALEASRQKLAAQV